MLVMADTDIFLKRLATPALAILYKLFMVIVEADIGPRPANLTLINQVTMVYPCIYMLILVSPMILFITM